MLLTLDDYFLLQEVVCITGKDASYYSRTFSNDIITILHNRYIKRECLLYSQREKMTELINCVPLRQFADYLCTSKITLIKRIDFMKQNPSLKYFDYKEIGAVTYIQVNDEMKSFLNNYSAIVIQMSSDCKNYNIKHNRFLGDLNIGFWE